MSEIRDKKVLITGAGGGFGVEMCKKFLEEGAYLILSDREESMLRQLMDRVKSIDKSRVLDLIPADLSTAEGCSRLVNSTRESAGVPDILVNNAGIAVMGPFSSVPSSKWEKILDINLYAPMRITHSFLPDMIERGSGHIVNISSVAGLVAVPGLATYSVSKFGIKAFGEALEKEVSQLGIRVTNLYPFFTRTPILESEQIGMKESKKVPDILLSDPEDVIDRLIRGIKKNEVHVHPGGISLLAEAGNRFFPGVLNSLNNLLVGR